MLIPAASLSERDAGEVSGSIRAVWRNPSDILSILLIIGGDVIAKALAQFSGPKFVPIPFSFGWVAYSFTTLMSVFGDGRLLPPPDYNAKLFNIKSGISRDNRSWVIGRFLRDQEVELGSDAGLKIAIYRVKRGGGPSLDRWYWSGVVVILVQFGVAAIPVGLYGDYSIILVTGIGAVLALLTGLLPQWRTEKYPGRRGRKQVVAITGGNGSQHVIVVINGGDANTLNLEDLAGGRSPRVLEGKPTQLPTALRATQVSCIALAVAWIILLFLAIAVKSNTWYILIVGGLGMLENVLVAGAQRSPSTNMLHIELVEIIHQKKGMHALMDAERGYPKLGRALVSEFFGDGLKDEEEGWWDGDRAEYDAQRFGGEKEVSFIDNSGLSTHIQNARAEYVEIMS